MKVVATHIVREIDVDPAVVLWNHLDFAHLTVVHRNYLHADLVYEDERVVLECLTHRVPGVPFVRSHSMHFFLKRSAGEIVAFTRGLFSVPIVTRIRLQRLGPERTRVTVSYRFALEGWRKWLAPVLPSMARRWNDRVWREDLPLKLRRQKALRAGFQDFVGLPESVADRHSTGPFTTDFSVRGSLLFPAEAMRLWHLFLDESEEEAQPAPGSLTPADSAG